MAIVGEGTPLPVDTARKLLVTGPYGYVRNPLVIATTGQSVAIGLALGSVPVLSYAFAILAGWYFFVRRAEERYLEQQFGKSWHDYKRRFERFVRDCDCTAHAK